MKKLLILALSAVLVLALAACGSGKKTDNAEKTDSKNIVLGTSADYAPYEFMYPDKNGDMIYGGIDISVANYIADAMEKELKIENMDFGYLLTALNKGDFDMVLACIEPTDARKKAVDFSDPYYKGTPEKILVRAEDKAKYKNVEKDFDGVSVGAQTGTTKIDTINEVFTGANAVSLSLVPDLVNELVNGKIDAIFLDGEVADQYVASNSALTVSDASDYFKDKAQTYCAVVAKGDPKGLLPDINKAIAKLNEENKMEEFIKEADSLSGVAQEVTADAPEGYTPDEE